MNLPTMKAIFSRQEDLILLQRILDADAVFTMDGFQCPDNGFIRVFITPPTKMYQLRIHGQIKSSEFKGPTKHDLLNFTGNNTLPQVRSASIPCPKYECREIVLCVPHEEKIRMTTQICKQDLDPWPIDQGLKSLGSMLLNDDASKDFTIITSDGKSLQAHSAVLSVHSEFFRTMKNFREGQTATLKAEEGSEAWDQLLHFVYERKLQINQDTMLNLIEMGIKYQIPDLASQAWTFALEHVDGRIAPRAFLFACRHDHSALQQRCARLVKMYAEDLIADPLWVDLHHTTLTDPEFGPSWAKAIRSA